MVVEILQKHWYTKLFHSSAPSGKEKNSNEGMKIPVEPLCVIFRSDSKVYGNPENLIYILFKYKKMLVLH